MNSPISHGQSRSAQSSALAPARAHHRNGQRAVVRGEHGAVPRTGLPEFDQSRAYLCGLHRCAQEAAALFVLLGFELKRLKSVFGDKRGVALPNDNNCCRLAKSSTYDVNLCTWAQLLKRELGISREWARKAMAAADAYAPELPDHPSLDDVRPVVKAPSVRQLCVQLGLLSECSPRGGDTSWARRQLAGRELKNAREEFVFALEAFGRVLEKELWKQEAIPDQLLEYAADQARQFAKDAAAWLRIPRRDRYAPLLP